MAAFPASNAPGVYGLALIAYGLTIILLLVVPRSSRAWFSRQRAGLPDCIRTARTGAYTGRGRTGRSYPPWRPPHGPTR
ncbi:hypothetical protein [Streptomyces fulvoviolaceus]|uniref:hypothetical protein n=1 Tax=Streptomyces fulvoviolaceus TaxID=285535 RepID=UPI00131A7945|nr:hypothetical protein [Streptomyces fulvoviolaceus]